jgi:uncharacterized protein YciI
MEYEKFYLIMLKDGEIDEPESEKLLAAIRVDHLGYQTMLHFEHGAVAGPLRGERGSIQGLTLVPERALTLEQARALAEGDPAVKAGYLSVKVVEWHVGKGLVELHKNGSVDADEGEMSTGS